MKTGIYKITNIINNKIYIGSAVNIKNRWARHIGDLSRKEHHSIKLQRSYDKHGIDSFKFEIIEECSKENLIIIEQHYIDLFDTYNNGYNCSPIAGNTLGFKHSEESKKKMSISRKGLNTWSKGSKSSDETKRKLSIAGKGRKHTSESKNKISKSKMGHKVTKKTRKKLRIANTGQKRSQETILKMKNKVVSEETKKKMSAKHTGRNNSKYNPTPVLQFDVNDNLIKEWQDLFSLNETEFNPKSVSKVCRGESKTHIGYKWKFKY
jgi:group I intron endonuclease